MPRSINTINNAMPFDFSNSIIEAQTRPLSHSLADINSTSSSDEAFLDDFLEKNDIVEQNCILCNSSKHTSKIKLYKTVCFICKQCQQKYIEECCNCHRLFDKKRLFNVPHNNKLYCVYCLCDSGYQQCHNCHQWRNDIVYIHNNFHYCRECLHELSIETFKCSTCGRNYLQDRYGKNGCCITCINSELHEVRNYSYKPQPRFFKERSEFEDLYLGVELEMGCATDSSIVNDFVAEYSNNFFYMKKDTSIPIYGCEIVTQPATLKKHINSKYWKALLDASKECGFSSNNNKCGIHIHVSKSFFNDIEISLLDCFVNSYDFWKKIARRESHYSIYVSKDEDSWGRQTTNRRCALNLSNPETIEFRIFQGTLEYDEIMAYLEVCHAASFFVKKCENNIINLEPQNKNNVVKEFVTFVHKNKYTYLEKYITKFKVFQ